MTHNEDIPDQTKQLNVSTQRRIHVAVGFFRALPAAAATTDELTRAACAHFPNTQAAPLHKDVLSLSPPRLL